MVPYAAFMIGLLGSLHCLGMCGPIAFALPVRTSDVKVKFLKYLIYNLGRVSIYAVMGLLAGLAGKALAIAGLQQIVSIVSGILIVVSLVFVYNPLKFAFLNNATNYLKDRLKPAFRIWFQKKGNLALFVLGLLNGLLPCGMVYMALLGALSAGNAVSGAAFMAAFGLGTVPLMLTVSLLGNWAGSGKIALLQKAMPLAMCLTGVLLIARGFHVEVPIINPANSCCHIQH